MQKSHMLKEEASSFVVATESLLLSRVINAKEYHDIIAIDTLCIFAQCSILESISNE